MREKKTNRLGSEAVHSASGLEIFMRLSKLAKSGTIFSFQILTHLVGRFSRDTASSPFLVIGIYFWLSLGLNWPVHELLK